MKARHVKASARLVAIFGRSAATRASSRRAKGTGAPSSRLVLAPLLAALALLVLALAASSASAAQTHVFAASFGSEGSGPGQLELREHSGVAINQETGDVSVADTGNSRVEQFEADGTFVRTFGSFTTPTFIAIDNSVGGEGDVYVADSADNTVSKFDSEGTLISSWGSGGSLDGSTATAPVAGPFATLAGIAVDPSGDLWVYDEAGNMFEFAEGGGFLTDWNSERGVEKAGIAVDSTGDLYVGTGAVGVAKFTPAGVQIGDIDDSFSSVRGIAIDPGSGDLYAVNGGEEVRRYPASCDPSAGFCTPAEMFGAGELTGGAGVAIGSSNASAFVTNATASNVDVFTLQNVEPPTATIAGASAVTATTAHLTGTVNPEGHLTTCRFEYVTDAHFTAQSFTGAETTPCSTQPGSGSSPVTVEADLNGLEIATLYHVRLAATNAGGTTVSVEPNPTFTTSAVPPTIGASFVSALTSNTAIFNAQINPGGAATQYHFEYLTKEQFDNEGGFSSPNVVGTPSSPLATSEVQLLNVQGSKGGFFLEFAGEISEEIPFTTSVTETAVIERALRSLPAIGPEGASVVEGGRQQGFKILFEGPLAGRDVPQIEIKPGAPPKVSAHSETLTPGGVIATDNALHEVFAMVTGLQPQTEYVFRTVTTNAQSSPGEIVSSTAPFLTAAVTRPSAPCPNDELRQENASLGLPDCRAYERVSPASSAEVYAPQAVAGKGQNGSGTNISSRPFQAATGGDAVTYVGEAPASGESGSGSPGKLGTGDQYLAEHGRLGWSSGDIAPLGRGSEDTRFEAFTPDLSAGILRSSGAEPPLAPGVTTECALLYSRASAGGGAFSPFFASGECGEMFFVGSSVDASHLLFESAANKTDDAEPAPGGGEDNIYDLSGGSLHLVNVLPGATPPSAPHASVGGLTADGPLSQDPVVVPAINAAAAVSADGSRVFWTDLATGLLYLRENPAAPPSALNPAGECIEAAKACTVPVSSGPATYQLATPDGRFVYFTESGRLWRFDAETGTLLALTPAGAGFQGIIGVNQVGEDGSYLYFVASGSLTADAEARTCEAANGNGSAAEHEEAREEALGEIPTGRGCNLYLLHAGETKLVAVLSAADNEFRAGGGQSGGFIGDWRPVVGRRTAQVATDGRSLVFMSRRRLTPYNNLDERPGGGRCQGQPLQQIGEHRACTEIYVFAADSGRIDCVSCSLSGEPPSQKESLVQAPSDAGAGGTFLPVDQGSDGILRSPTVISADGDRVFFDTVRPLLPSDTNGLQDVYEWERAGTGTCTEPSPFVDGCLSLLSGGKSSDFSALVGTDPAGQNAFFVTREPLIPTDTDHKTDLYDARVEGGFPVPARAQICEEEGCKGPVPSPPPNQSPGSSTFQANEPPPTKCKKGKVKKRGKCVAKKHKAKKHKKKAHRKRSHRAASHNRGGPK